MRNKIVVAGGNGYVGKKILYKLSELDFEVYSLVRSSDWAEPYLLFKINKLSQMEIWRGKLQDLGNTLEEQCVSQIINAAASVRKDSSNEALIELIESNIAFNSLLADVCLNHKIPKFVTISTYSIYDLEGEYLPQTLYSASKKAAEDILEFYALTGNLDITILYPYDIYGPEQPHKRFLNSLIEAIKNGDVFRMSPGKQEVNFIHIDDVIDGIIYTALQEPSMISSKIKRYCLYGHQTYLLQEIPQILSDLIGKPEFIRQVVKNLPYRKNELMVFKPKHALPPGWAPTIDFESGIKNLLDY